MHAKRLSTLLRRNLTQKKLAVIILALCFMILIFQLKLVRFPRRVSPKGRIKDKPTYFQSVEELSYQESKGPNGSTIPARQDETCDTVEIAIVCAGYNASREVVTLIKSVLFYRRSPLHIHFIVDSVAKVILGNLFRTWGISDFTVSFYLTGDLEEKVSWIPNFHYSGVYGLLKLLLLDVLPEETQRIIVLDIDLLFLVDISKLWKQFQKFKPKQAIGLVENQSDWYLGKLQIEHKPWPAIGRGFNTGLMLLDCDSLRKMRWNDIWQNVAKTELVRLSGTSLADQDIINAVIKRYPDLVHPLPCFWNVQFSLNTHSELCYRGNVSSINVLHWNSPKKQKRKITHANNFRNLFYSFVEYNGALLKNPISFCTEKDDSIEEQYYEENSCQEMLYKSLQLHRTHLYFLPFDYVPVDPNDVTLSVHLSMERLPMLDEICKYWLGPISAAVFLGDSDTTKLIKYVNTSPVLSARRNIGYHLVFRNFEDVGYPINLLRNTAWQQVTTTYVFLCDVDFIPSMKLYEYLKNAVLPSYERDSKYAYVLPAFESLWYKFDFPTTKSQLLDQWDKGILTPFRSYMWPAGHSATNYTRWRQATKMYTITRTKDYEPYVVVAKHLCPSYDKRFFGFGWNKVSHIMELDAAGFHFLALPFGFVIHVPHMASLDIMKYRSSKKYRRCIDDIKIQFVNDLVLKYGIDEKKFT